MGDLSVHIYGSRGSTPTPYHDRMMFGGNTSCITVADAHTGRALIIDAGTGIIGLGERLMKGPCRELDLFISHAHLDHLQGIPFFAPFFSREFSIRIYGERRSGLSIQEQISASMREPLWPVNIEAFQSRIEYIDIEVGKPILLESGFQVDTLRSCHPNLCTLYKISKYGKSVVYALDFEHAGDSLQRLAEFAKDTGLLIYDSQYTDEEYPSFVGWGHSTWQKGAALAEKCGAQRLLFSHHKPGRTDTENLELQRLAQARFPNCAFAREGEEIIL